MKCGDSCAARSDRRNVLCATVLLRGLVHFGESEAQGISALLHLLEEPARPKNRSDHDQRGQNIRIAWFISFITEVGLVSIEMVSNNQSMRRSESFGPTMIENIANGITCLRATVVHMNCRVY